MPDVLTGVLLRPLADAFLEVGVFVALLVAPFAYARWRWGDRLDALLVRHASLGPLVGAALTMPPGCGGAIVTVAAYARGAVSFGTAVAALTATMGDASWVLLAADPLLTLQLKVLLLVVGAATGYAVDALGISPRRRSIAPAELPSDPAAAPLPVGASAAVAVPRLPAQPALHDLGLLPAVLWVVVGGGAAVSLPVTFQVLDPGTLSAAVGGWDPYLLLGLTGTLVCVVAFVRGGCRLADDTLETARSRSLPQVLRHAAAEVAFVTVWVAVAYVAWEVLGATTGFDGSQLPMHGVLGVLAGALIGLVPGCGAQITFAGIFLAGGMPLPTLVANTVSQDGDALLPLLALERRSALVATCLTTVPAVLVGSALLVVA